MKKAMLLAVTLVLALTGCGAKSDKSNADKTQAESSYFPDGYKRLIFGASISDETLENIVGDAYDDAENSSDSGNTVTTSAVSGGNETVTTTTKKGAVSTDSSSTVVFEGDDRVKDAIEQGFAVPVPVDDTYKIDRIVSYGASKKSYGIFPTDSTGKDAGTIMVFYHTEPGNVRDTISPDGIGEREIIDTQIELGGKKYDAVLVINTLNVGGTSSKTKALHFMTDEHTKFSVSISAYSTDKSDEALIDFVQHFDFSNAVIDADRIEEKAE